MSHCDKTALIKEAVLFYWALKGYWQQHQYHWRNEPLLVSKYHLIGQKYWDLISGGKLHEGSSKLCLYYPKLVWLYINLQGEECFGLRQDSPPRWMCKALSASTSRAPCTFELSGLEIKPTLNSESSRLSLLRFMDCLNSSTAPFNATIWQQYKTSAPTSQQPVSQCHAPFKLDLQQHLPLNLMWEIHVCCHQRTLTLQMLTLILK